MRYIKPPSLKTIRFIHGIVFTISFNLLRIPVYILSILPLPVLYGLCRIMAWLIFRIFKYRRRVIAQNMKIVFPDSPPEFRRNLENEFIAHFADTIAEILKGFTISREALRNRMDIRISEEMAEDLRAHRDIFIAGAHVNNWEWAVITAGDQLPCRTIAVYKPLSNQSMNQLMTDLRQRANTLMVSMGLVFRDILTEDRPVSAYLFLSDQSTPFSLTAHQVDFFGVKTPFVPGMSTMAARQNIPIYYFTIEKIKRGHYVARFDLLVRDTSQYKPEEITTLYSKKLEENILNQPACWLWTHKRWKRVLEY